MANELSRLQTRFLGNPDAVEDAATQKDHLIEADEADQLGLVTFAFDDIDWEERSTHFS